MSALSKYEIRRFAPFRNVLIVIVTVIITTILVSAYQYRTIKSEIFQIKALKQQNSKLLIKNKQLIHANQTRMKKQAFLAIQQSTNEQLKQQTATLQHDIVLLKKELLFYQSAIQGNSNGELQFRKLYLYSDLKQPDKVAYRLAVTQGKRVNKPITGTVTVMLNTKDGQIVVGKHALKLEYIQILNGQIDMTAKMPASITVSLTQRDKRVLSKTFNWQLNDHATGDKHV